MVAISKTIGDVTKVLALSTSHLETKISPKKSLMLALGFTASGEEASLSLFHSDICVVFIIILVGFII